MVDKNDQQIMVVPVDKLFPQGIFQGFQAHSVFDYESLALNNHSYMRRGNAEEDTTHKQPIRYCMIVNPKTRKIFAFRRAQNEKHYHESRLQGNWSWGVGGHIEQFDTSGEENPIHSSMLREISEEVEIKGSITPVPLGYINDDSNSVGQVHFGILYLILTDAEDVTPKERELETGRFHTLEELIKIIKSPECTVENWSQIALEPLIEYLK